MSGASGLPRLLRGIEDGGTLTLAQHGRVHGPLDMSGRDAAPVCSTRSSTAACAGAAARMSPAP